MADQNWWDREPWDHPCGTGSTGLQVTGGGLNADLIRVTLDGNFLFADYIHDGPIYGDDVAVGAYIIFVRHGGAGSQGYD